MADTIQTTSSKDVPNQPAPPAAPAQAAPPEEPKGPGPLLNLYAYGVRLLGAEFSFFGNALHELRCFFALLVPRFYRCGGLEQSGPVTHVCEKGQQTFWWAGFCFVRKCELWKDHVHQYRRIKANSNDPPTDATGIDFLGGCLGTVDAKFGTLLTFNGMLLTAAAIVGSTFLAGSPFPYPTPNSLLGFVFWFCFLGLIGFWAWTIYLCVRSQAIVVWGDMWKHQPGERAAAEDAESREMIGEVVMRSARLRIAVLLTFISIGLGFATFSAAKAVRAANAGSTTESIQLGTLGAREYLVSFRPGEDCAEAIPFDKRVIQSPTGTGTASLVELLMTEAMQSGNRTLRVIGSADAQPLSPAKRTKYGNNVGLALARAYCIAGQAQTTLAQRGVFLSTAVSVRSSGPIGPSASDRAVTLRLIP